MDAGSLNSPLVRILVADDDPTGRLLMQSALERSGFRPVMAEDGLMALRLFEEEAVDMILLDVDMPHMDGFAVCSALRRRDGADWPIVMVTGMDDVTSIQKSFDCGATDFIAKPINWNLIGHRVQHIWASHQNQKALHLANAHNAALIEAMPDAIFRLRADGMVLEGHCPPGVSQVGYPRLGELVSRRLSAQIASAYQDGEARARTQGHPSQFEYESREDGQPPRHLEVRTAVLNEHETLCMVRDVSGRKEAERKLFRLAYFDTLTGLPNRPALMAELAREVQRAAFDGRSVGVLALDLDGFKHINDTLGRAAGDSVLQLTAARLQRSLRASDVISRAENGAAEGAPAFELARLDGDEFTLLIPQMKSADDAVMVAERLGQAMREPFVVDGHEVVVTASIGIAIFPQDGTCPDTLIKHVETSLHHAKASGRDTYAVYSTTLTDKAVHRLMLENAMRRALDREEFELHYQPQVDIASGRIRSVEALVRWRHPERGLLSPLEFIPLAEENGMIRDLGEWVLRAACADAAAWCRRGLGLRVAVNLSPLQCRERALVDYVRDALRASALPADRLELEITESALLDGSALTEEIMREVRGLGVLIALDDFGTGYSSLGYLRRLPLHNLKIDRSFVSGLPADVDSMAIVRAIISMATNLGLSVTAEGIESREQGQILQALSCHVLQGYYISKPCPPAEIPMLCAGHWDFSGNCAAGTLDITAIEAAMPDLSGRRRLSTRGGGR